MITQVNRASLAVWATFLAMPDIASAQKAPVEGLVKLVETYDQMQTFLKQVEYAVGLTRDAIVQRLPKELPAQEFDKPSKKLQTIIDTLRGYNPPPVLDSSKLGLAVSLDQMRQAADDDEMADFVIQRMQSFADALAKQVVELGSTRDKLQKTGKSAQQTKDTLVQLRDLMVRIIDDPRAVALLGDQLGFNVIEIDFNLSVKVALIQSAAEKAALKVSGVMDEAKRKQEILSANLSEIKQLMGGITGDWIGQGGACDLRVTKTDADTFIGRHTRCSSGQFGLVEVVMELHRDKVDGGYVGVRAQRDTRTGDLIWKNIRVTRNGNEITYIDDTSKQTYLRKKQ